MANVYLAEDCKDRRQVTLKVLLPGLTAFLGVERFLKEIEIAAHLTHPHILALYDSGEAGGFLYYVMPYIDGGSLRQEIEGGRRLSGARALAVAAPVADALGYAHKKGILHRDIKPENILFSQGHPVVADFGIAKAVSTAGGTDLTRTGFPIGTAAAGDGGGPRVGGARGAGGGCTGRGRPRLRAQEGNPAPRHQAGEHPVLAGASGRRGLRDRQGGEHRRRHESDPHRLPDRHAGG